MNSQNILGSFFRTLVAVLFVSACGPATHSPSSPPVSSASANQTPKSDASEVNRALATIAMATSIPTADYQVGPEDLLQVTLFNIPTTEATHTPRQVTVRVSQQGMISLPLLGEVKVSGLTPSGLERELKKLYEKYMYNPQVGVLVAEYRQRVSVIGAVQKTGDFELSGPKTVIDILAMAGGVAPNAGTQVHIYRQGPEGRESHVIDLLVVASNATLINANNANLITMPIQAGDVINVPPAGMFFVDGAIKSPGSYALGRRYTLTQAIASAGGVDRELNSSEITIFRRGPSSEMQPIIVDLSAVHAGTTPDPQIEADDVIVVPVNPAKYFVRRFVGSLIGGISVGSIIGMAGS